MQSITWEAVRTLFTPQFKTEENVAKVREIWECADAGEITHDQAFDQIVEFAGGIKPTVWETSTAAKEFLVNLQAGSIWRSTYTKDRG